MIRRHGRALLEHEHDVAHAGARPVARHNFRAIRAALFIQRFDYEQLLALKALQLHAGHQMALYLADDHDGSPTLNPIAFRSIG